MEGLTPEKVINLLNENRKILLVDTRSFLNYSECHVETSINVCIPSTLVKRNSFNVSKIETLITCEKAKQKLRERGGYDMILYDDNCDSQKNPTVSILMDKFSKEGLIKSVSYIKGGFNALFQRFPNYCKRVEKEECISKETPLKCESDMDQVTDYLYIGSQFAAINQDRLKHTGITHILNCAKELPNHFESSFSYLKLSLSDCPSQVIDATTVETAVNFINDAKTKGGKVLVHCFAGQSRSAAIVLAHLMTANKTSFNESYTFLKRKRECVSPNLGFISQLVSLESKILGTSPKIPFLSFCKFTPSQIQKEPSSKIGVVTF